MRPRFGEFKGFGGELLFSPSERKGKLVVESKQGGLANGCGRVVASEGRRSQIRAFVLLCSVVVHEEGQARSVAIVAGNSHAHSSSIQHLQQK